MHITRRAVAEFLGTFWLVLCGCGAAVIATGYDGSGIGFVGVSLAFGFAVLTAAYALGPISGAHLNPAVTLGIWAAGRFKGRDIPFYIAAQLAGAIAASSHYSLAGGFITEAVLTCGFLIVILGATDGRSLAGFGPLAIGISLTLIHLVSIPVTNTSVNPARSTGPALLVGRDAIEQLWLFWAAPILGALIGALIYRWLFAVEAEVVAVEAERVVPA
ncbi:MAG: aquaporin [Alphaproteobacteria bacterium]|nr:MAG: aquaporin [Alphaproteobacteria bacterium]